MGSQGNNMITWQQEQQQQKKKKKTETSLSFIRKLNATDAFY